jgi:hypothetical protein
MTLRRLPAKAATSKALKKQTEGEESNQEKLAGYQRMRNHRG